LIISKICSPPILWALTSLYLVFLSLGVFLPILRVEKFFFFEEHLSLYDVLTTLFQQQEYLLSIVVAGFSFVLPYLKAGALAAYLTGQHPNNKALKSLKIISKWSMLDVLLIALLVAGFKAGYMQDAEILLGFIFFSLAAGLSIILMQAIECLSCAPKEAIEK